MATVKKSYGGAVGDGLRDIFTRLIPAVSKPPFAEHSRVKAVRDICEGGETVSAGSTGTIVHVIHGGRGYDVEFTWPKRVVISALPSELDVA
jgi:hypothetical protein